jgi:AraC-like DNA-binding protein
LVHQVVREFQLQLHPGPRDGRRTTVLDDLVAFIRATAPDQRLSLTDLEERSHFSARYLQVLFREAFDCTPMRFVHRQRLAVAMEKLQTADCAHSVTRIARDCGYGHLSNFTSDFRREFGINPSQVLRGAVRSTG